MIVTVKRRGMLLDSIPDGCQGLSANRRSIVDKSLFHQQFKDAPGCMKVLKSTARADQFPSRDSRAKDPSLRSGFRLRVNVVALQWLSARPNGSSRPSPERRDVCSICAASLPRRAAGGQPHHRDSQATIEKEAPQCEPHAGLRFWVVPRAFQKSETGSGSRNIRASGKAQRQRQQQQFQQHCIRPMYRVNGNRA